ncbi:MAG: bifunctional methylenetetrahydrofolate dehydrogenase/methenyltetrahydrofolate cyclohydrolase FolD [Pelagimonas sp.]|uniref:bifunctional methylenetetrahydrofolate dehydrogenase/methenyltetrahydrofolate cyclohydrolase FolD n=1 Tax=Pelagimonas sp. TaxID=2073170 RepID=UPI003D6A6F6E
MTATIIEGKAFAADMRATIATRVSALKEDTGITPGLALVLVGRDPASQTHIRTKGKQALECGMALFHHDLDAETRQSDVLALIQKLNAEPAVHGILVQLPLPDHLDEEMVVQSISPEKDVDGFHISNAGLLATGQAAMVPCTPLGCLMLLRHHLGNLSGLNAVVVGETSLASTPMAQLLMRDSCTVTIAHSGSQNIQELCRRADILVADIDRPKRVTGDWIKPGATVIDMGNNRIEIDGGGTRLVGDVDFETAAGVAGAITPVPGGVGPMTIACLLANTLTACCHANALVAPEGLTA